MKSPRLPLRLAAPVLLAACALAACASAPQSGRNSTPAQAAAVIQVENHNFLDMAIYVYPRSGARRRLGLAPGNATTSFTIPASLLFGSTALRFLGDPVGGNATPISQEIGVAPGDTITMVIPAT